MVKIAIKIIDLHMFHFWSHFFLLSFKIKTHKKKRSKTHKCHWSNSEDMIIFVSSFVFSTNHRVFENKMEYLNCAHESWNETCTEIGYFMRCTLVRGLIHARANICFVFCFDAISVISWYRVPLKNENTRTLSDGSVPFECQQRCFMRIFLFFSIFCPVARHIST